MKILVDMNLSPDWVTVLTNHNNNEALLETGALIIVDEGRSRVRILPLGQRA